MRAHQDRIYNLAYRLTGNHEDANDAAREAFVRAFQALPRFRQDAAFSTWLYRIATNAALDLVRRRPAVPPRWSRPSMRLAGMMCDSTAASSTDSDTPA